MQAQNPDPDLSKATLDPRIENYIAFDVLGGVFRKSMEMEAMVLDGGEEAAPSAAKLSINVLPPKTETKDGQKSFLIDAAYSFVGKNGSGKLVISASGNGADEYISA